VVLSKDEMSIVSIGSELVGLTREVIRTWIPPNIGGMPRREIISPLWF
jgi:hypothetical protein